MTEPKRSLFDSELSTQLTKIIFSESHGAFDDHLGAGGLYYALALMIRSQVSVCIGSGGGFVPRILRQAQRDLRLSNAKTYLVDANLPDLGFGHPEQEGGWLTPGNDLQTGVPGLSVLRMLSTDAAQLFASADMTIDYLHIDGDHSTRGVLADVADYLPLLSANAVVSLHDLRMDSVRQAISDIGLRYPALEWITFGEIGDGTAILRSRANDVPRSLPVPAREDLERTTSIPEADVMTEVARSQDRARYDKWHYLTTAAYRSRYDLVAKSVDLPNHTVVELGGYPNTVVRHLTLAKRVIAIEPYAPPGYLAEARAIADERGIDLLVRHAVLGTAELNTDLFGKYTFVALGLDISPGCDSLEEFHAALQSLAELAGNAEVVALEIPRSPPSKVALRYLLACMEPEVICDMTIDLGDDPVADEYVVKDDRAKRRILVYRPGRLVKRSMREAAASQYAPRLLELSRKTSVEDREYAIGETLRFRADSDSGRFLVRGWGDLEAEQVWALGDESELELDVSEPLDADRPLRLQLEIVPFVVPGNLPLQRLSISINGTAVYGGEIQSQSLLDVPVPDALLPHGGAVRIVLDHPDGARPRDLLDTKDARVISVALVSCALVRDSSPSVSPV